MKSWREEMTSLRPRLDAVGERKDARAAHTGRLKRDTHGWTLLKVKHKVFIYFNHVDVTSTTSQRRRDTTMTSTSGADTTTT